MTTTELFFVFGATLGAVVTNLVWMFVTRP
jgi:hypothetical protein